MEHYMTETQRLVLDRLYEGSMTLEELAEQAHFTNGAMNKVLKNMLKSKWIDLEDGEYSLVLEYAPSLEWDFKPLMNAWKI